MDAFLIQIFEAELAFQCRCIELAYLDLKRAELARSGDAMFYALQALLVAAANASKLLWGSGGKRKTDRAQLRQRLAISDDSPLHDPDLRNDFEHVDDRIDDWFKRSANHVYLGRNIGAHAAFHIEGSDESDRFQHYDPSTETVTFWQHSVSVRSVVEEAGRVLAKTSEATVLLRDLPRPPA